MRNSAIVPLSGIKVDANGAFFFPRRGLTDGTDGYQDIFINLTQLGFELEANQIKVHNIPTGWTKRFVEPNILSDIYDDRGNRRISFRLDFAYDLNVTMLWPRFSLKYNYSDEPILSNEAKGHFVLFDKESGLSTQLIEDNVYYKKDKDKVYHKNGHEIRQIIDAHLPNLRNPFDHWGQDRTRPIQNMLKELEAFKLNISEQAAHKRMSKHRGMPTP
jgi:hypothetical protein